MHPVRFTRKQVKYIRDIIDEFYDFYEEECKDLDATLDGVEDENDLHPVRFSEAQIEALNNLIVELQEEDYDLGEDQIPSILSVIASAEDGSGGRTKTIEKLRDALDSKDIHADVEGIIHELEKGIIR